MKNTILKGLSLSMFAGIIITFFVVLFSLSGKNKNHMHTTDIHNRELLSLSVKFYVAVNIKNEDFYLSEYETELQDFHKAIVSKTIYYFRYTLKLNEKFWKIRELNQHEYLIYNSWIFKNTQNEK